MTQATQQEITQAYSDILGRDPDVTGLNHYLNSGKDITTIRGEMLHSDEAVTKGFSPKYDLRPGNPTKFGHADYAYALIDDPTWSGHPHGTKDTEFIGHRGDAAKQQDIRQAVISWLAGAGSQYLDDPNKPGGSGEYNLWDAINNPRLDPAAWGDHSDPDADAQISYFGGRDLDAARAGGFTDLQIKTFLDENPNLLRDKNVPGGGGVYDWLKIPGDNGGDNGGDDGGDDGDPEDGSHWSDPYSDYDESDIKPTVSDIDYLDWSDTPSTNIPSITRNQVQFNERQRLTIDKSPGESLYFKPKDTMIAKRTKGALRKPRPKYRQTTDLARQARNSLNIS